MSPNGRFHSLILIFPIILVSTTISSCLEDVYDSSRRSSRQPEVIPQPGSINTPSLPPVSPNQPSVQTPSPAAPKFSLSKAGIERKSYKKDLLSLVELYNGGLDGKAGAYVYRDDFNGYFPTNLNQSWQPIGGSATSAVAQSRWVFMNAMAYLAATPGENGDKFRVATSKGVKFLVEKFKDPEFGGYFHQVTQAGQVVDEQKRDFSNCQPLLALAAAYQTDRQDWQLREALNQVDFFLKNFSDPAMSGGIAPNLNRKLSPSSVHGFRNSECITHFFEGMLAIHDVADNEGKQKLQPEISKLGDFLVNRVIQAASGGDGSRKYIAFFFDQEWKPSQVSLNHSNLYQGSAWASIGHTFEVAYLLSRAVERGFNKNWLVTADAMMRFAIDFGFDRKTGATRFLVDYTGRSMPSSQDPLAGSYDWWPQCEAARALLHFAIVRNRTEYLALFKAQDGFIRRAFIDARYGGWYGRVTDLGNGGYRPRSTNKGDIWQDAYHQSMYYAEVLRLAQIYP